MGGTDPTTPDRTSLDPASLDDLVQSCAVEHHCPTVSWGVVRDRALVLAGSVGDVSEHTVYRIASMTKVFSAAATLALRDEGSIRLDDTIVKHAPELAALRPPTDDAAPITIRDLLTMGAGFVSDDPWADRHLDLTDDEFDAIIEQGVTFATTPGTTFEYSNFGYAVLGRVVHRATGRRLQAHITDRLLEPLGMTRTTWTRPDHDDRAPPMRWVDDHFEAEIETPADGVIAPMGGLWSTVADLARWISFLDDGAPARDGVDDGPLRRSSRRELQTSQRYVGNRREGGVVVPMSYGYGLRISVRGGRPTVVTHSGGLPGYGSSMRWLAGVGLGVVALANVTYAPMTRLATDLLTDVESQLAVVAPPPPVTPAIDRAGRRLAELLGAWDDAVAAGLFADNVELDDSWPRRRRAAERVAGLEVVEVAAINAGRGRVRGAGPDGAPVTIEFALAVDDDRRIQTYEIEVSAPPLTKPAGS